MKIKNFFLGVVSLFLLYSLAKGIFVFTDRFKIYQRLERKKKALEKKKIELQTRIKKAESLDYLEKKIRNDLQLVQPNETVVILSYPTPTPVKPTPTPLPIPLQWVEIFK